ncbi:hypothetical protein KCU81_g616, partial [Aureobasidium melanogenum]
MPSCSVHFARLRRGVPVSAQIIFFGLRRMARPAVGDTPMTMILVCLAGNVLVLQVVVVIRLDALIRRLFKNPPFSPPSALGRLLVTTCW